MLQHELLNLPCGRKFKIVYRDVRDYIRKEDIRFSRIRVIEGIIENFCPTAEVVVRGKDGFFISPNGRNNSRWVSLYD